MSDESGQAYPVPELDGEAAAELVLTPEQQEVSRRLSGRVREGK